jgi:CRP-like cAMP-binding protein
VDGIYPVKETSFTFSKIKKSNSLSEDFLKIYFANPDNNVYGWGPSQVYPLGFEIFQQDTPANNVYFIERGLVKLSCLESGGRSVIVSLRHSNCLLGAPATLLERPYAFTATTLTPCYLLTIPATTFLRLVKINKEFSMHLLRMLSKIIYDRGTKVIALGVTPAKERLKKILYEMILEQEPTELERPIQLHLPLAHRELAQLIAVTPEHLCRLLKEMEQQGIIKRNKGLVVVKKPSILLKVP